MPRLLHHPFSSSSPRSGHGLFLLPPAFFTYAGGADADLGVGAVPLCFPPMHRTGESDLPFLPFAVVHACTHAVCGRPTGEDKRALHTSAFVIGTAAEG